MKEEKKVLIISGQTATGKTRLGVKVGKELGGEIISFDSRQAYKKLNIVTGKERDKLKVNPDKIGVKSQPRPSRKAGPEVVIKGEEFVRYFRDSVAIWMYDLVDPKEYLSAHKFCKKAELVIENIFQRSKLPIVVGGTVFYIKAFLEGLDYKVGPDWKLREKLEDEPVEKLQERLKKLDKKKWLEMNQSDRQNKRRLIRVIEIKSSSVNSDQIGVEPQMSKSQPKSRKSFDYLFLALILDKEELREKIETRVRKRVEAGAVGEVKSLLKQGYSFDDPGLNTIGYKQLRGYLEGSISLNEAIEVWIKDEVDYARRQLVFLKKIEEAVFVNPEDKSFVEKSVQLVYKWYKKRK